MKDFLITILKKITVGYDFISEQFESAEEFKYFLIVMSFFWIRIQTVIDTISDWGFSVNHAYFAMLGQFVLYLGRMKFGKYLGKFFEFDENEKIGTKIFNFFIDLMLSGMFGLILTPFILPVLFNGIEVTAKNKNVAVTAIFIGLFYELILKVSLKAIAIRIQKIGKSFSDKK